MLVVEAERCAGAKWLPGSVRDIMADVVGESLCAKSAGRSTEAEMADVESSAIISGSSVET